MTIENQNNYPNTLLGYGTGTIKQYGCTLACLASVSNIPILELHTMLKGTSFKDSAFAGATKNLINWTQLEKHTNGKIKHVWRGYDYDQQKINEAIKKHGFCLVEVLNSGTKHWIVAIGNKKALDPLIGGEISTNKYPTWTGWEELEVKESMEETIQVEKKDWERARKSMDILKDVHSKLGLKEDHINIGTVPYMEAISQRDSRINNLSYDLKQCQLNSQKIKIEQEVNIAGIPMIINGSTVDSNGVVTANYRIK